MGTDWGKILFNNNKGYKINFMIFLGLIVSLLLVLSLFPRQIKLYYQASNNGINLEQKQYDFFRNQLDQQFQFEPEESITEVLKLVEIGSCKINTYNKKEAIIFNKKKSNSLVESCFRVNISGDYKNIMETLNSIETKQRDLYLTEVIIYSSKKDTYGINTKNKGLLSAEMELCYLTPTSSF